MNFIGFSVWILFATQLSAFADTCPPPSRDCKMNSVSKLCQYDHDDYGVYVWASKKADSKRFFFDWYQDCTHDGLTDVSTAIHETTHLMTSELQAYPLIDGGAIPLATCQGLTAKMLKPKTLAHLFDKNDSFVQIYLLGDATSATDFCFLLDEMNAYSHDLNTNTKLRAQVSVSPDPEDRRAGVLAMMAFLKFYADAASRTSPVTWAAMQGPLKNGIKELWHQAAAVLENSCGIADWGGRYHYDRLCDGQKMDAILSLTGEAPEACLSRANCRPENLDSFRRSE